MTGAFFYDRGAGCGRHAGTRRDLSPQLDPINYVARSHLKGVIHELGYLTNIKFAHHQGVAWLHLFFVTQRAYVLSPNVGPADIEDVQDDLMDALKPEKLEGMAPKMILCELGEWTSTAYP